MWLWLLLLWLCCGLHGCVCTCCACDGASRRPPRAGARHASRRARAGARVIVVDSGHGTRVSHGVRAQCVCCTYLRLPANLCRVGVCTALHDDCMTIAWRLHGDCCRGNNTSFRTATGRLPRPDCKLIVGLPRHGQSTSFRNATVWPRPDYKLHKRRSRPVFIAHKIKS